MDSQQHAHDANWIPMQFGDDSTSTSNCNYDLTRPSKRTRTAQTRRTLCLVLVCMAQLAFIMVLSVYIYLYETSDLSVGPNSRLQPDAEPNYYRSYENIQGEKRLVMVDVIKNCSQRKHDLQFGVQCQSSKPCKPVIENPQLLVDSRSPGERQSNRLATVVTTSKSGLRLHLERRQLARVVCAQTASSSRPIASPEPADPCRFETRLTVHLNRQQQTILGWGGALTDSSINVMLSLSTNATRQLLEDYFSPDFGLGYSIVRLTIGGSDFSSRFYTNDDLIGENERDFDMSHFALREEDLLYKIPVLNYVSKLYDSDRTKIKLMGSMWSPPTWMKTNRHFNKGQLRGQIHAPNAEGIRNDELYFESLAKLKKRWLLAYQERGINFWALTVMNEPYFAIQPFIDFNTMIFPQGDYANYIEKYLGPAIKSDSRIAHVKLIAHDDNRRYLMNFTDPVLSQPGARVYLDGIATHGYIDQAYELMDEIWHKHSFSFNNSSHGQSHANPSSSFFVLPNELCSGHLPFMLKALVGNWNRGVHYALDIIHGLKHRAAGWVDWNMALDVNGGPGWLGGRLDSPVIVDKQSDSYYKSPMFYVIGHFSRFVPPNSVKVASELINDLYDEPIESVSFLSPARDKLITIILNQNPYQVSVNMDLKSTATNGHDDDTNRGAQQQTTSTTFAGETTIRQTTLDRLDCLADSITTIIINLPTT